MKDIKDLRFRVRIFDETNDYYDLDACTSIQIIIPKHLNQHDTRDRFTGVIVNHLTGYAIEEAINTYFDEKGNRRW